MLRRLLDWLIARQGTLGARYRSANVSQEADRLIGEGNRLETAGKPREACALYRRAVAAAPRYAKAHLNLGIGLLALDDAEGAARSFEAALALDPADPYANYNLANLWYASNRREDAVRLLRLALERKPDFPEARVALANVLDSQGDAEAAVRELEIALRQRPDYAGALYNQALVLRKLQRLDEAEDALRRMLALGPGSGDSAASELAGEWAHRTLASVLLGQSRVGDALGILHAARAQWPDSLALESGELFMLNFDEAASAEAMFERHRAFGARMEAAHPPRFAPFANPKDPQRRLRVGYVSADFYRHPVALFVLPLIERHDRTAIETFCYSTTVESKADEVTRQLKSLAHNWRDAAAMSDAQLADAIHGDGIDILIDLAGHAGPRLGVFAQQPAPVQASWLGYLNTTGLTRIDYRLCDGHTDPPGTAEKFHTETPLRLPHNQWCYRPLLVVDQADEPSFARNGFVTFGSFNHVSKISATARRLWAEILSRVPDARLVIVGVPEGRTTNDLRRDFEGRGIAAERLSIVPPLPLDEYFRRFNAVDIALDTMPYSGGTTTCDAIWMGVPVLTAPGERPVSRSAASILFTAGLADWIAASPQNYVDLAVGFAHNRAALADLRGSLRRRMQGSPLMDEAGFVRDIEAAYRRMWDAWCGGAASG